MTKSQQSHSGGIHPETTALRSLLAAAGVRSPHDGKPFSEAMMLGLGGGLGVSYYVFQYKGAPPTFFISGRHLLQDNVAFLEGACARLGIKTAIKETSGAKAATENLRAALAPGPAIAWVDLQTLPYSGLPEWLHRMTYHLVTVYALDGEEAVIGDLPKGTIRLGLDELNRARAAIGTQKQRLLTASAPAKLKPLDAAVRAAIRECADGLLGGRSWNTRLDAIKKWGDLMTAKNKEAWPVVFTPGLNLFMGMARAYTFIEVYGTGGGLLRGLYADFLDEASAVLPKLGGLGEAAGRYRKLGQKWSALARAFLPEAAAPLGETRALLARYGERFLARAPVSELHGLVAQLAKQRDAVVKKLPLDDAAVKACFAEWQARLHALYQDEHQAITDLAAAVK